MALLCDGSADPVGARLREEWARAVGLWSDVAESEDGTFDPRGEPLTRAFVALLVDIVRSLHQGDIERIFDRALPVLIHELEYYDEIATQNLAANPEGSIDDFVSWCRGW